jgi:hypothetical protein
MGEEPPYFSTSPPGWEKLGKGRLGEIKGWPTAPLLSPSSPSFLLFFPNSSFSFSLPPSPSLSPSRSLSPPLSRSFLLPSFLAWPVNEADVLPPQN